jgi:hypothetical protein
MLSLQQGFGNEVVEKAGTVFDVQVAFKDDVAFKL